MMIDEIQTGFGRTGTWFGFQQHDVVPDVVTLAKAIGNGMPVGACWAKREVSAVFQPGDHGSTYSGTALATAAVSAVVDEMRRIDAPGLARKQGGRLDVAARADPAGRRRSVAPGLLLGAQLAEGIDAPTVYKALLVARVDLQRRQRVDAAVRPAAHGQRRRARRGGGPRRRRPGRGRRRDQGALVPRRHRSHRRRAAHCARARRATGRVARASARRIAAWR